MTKAFRPKRQMSFRNKYLALFVVAAFFFLNAQGQHDPTKYTRFRYLYGNRSPRLWADSVLIPPADTTLNKTGIALLAGTFYTGNGTYWSVVTGSSATDVASLNRRPYTLTLAQLRSLGSGVATDSTIFYIRDRGKEGGFYYDASDVTSADDTAMIVVSGTKRFKRIFDRIIFPEWWDTPFDPSTTANATGPDAGPGFNRMFRWMERVARGSYEVHFQHNNYYIGTTVTFPYTIQTLPNDVYHYVKMYGPGVTMRTNVGITMFKRMPANDTDVGLMNSNYKLLIEGLYFLGDRSTDAQNGIRIGTTYGGEISYCHFYGLDTAIIGNFLTKFNINHNFFTVNKRTDIVLQSLYGLVGTQQIAGSATNFCNIKDNRFFKETGSYAAIELRATDNTVIDHNIIEGAQPRFGIISDFLGSTVSNTLLINDLWFEGNSASPSVNFRITGAGLTRISNVQRTYVDTLFDFSGSQAAAQFVFDGFTYAGNMSAKPFRAGAADPFMSGRSIRVTNSDPAFTTLLFTASSWVDGEVPFNVTSDYYQGSNNGYTVESGGNIELQPKGQSTEFNGFVVFRGNQTFKTDNIDVIGSDRGATNFRPNRIYVGDGGFFVDNGGRFKFGKADVTPDLTLAHDSTGQLGIKDNASGYTNIKGKKAIFTEESGYTTSFTLASMQPYSWVTKEQLQQEINAINTLVFDPNLLPNPGTAISPITIDTSAGKIATKSDVANAVGIGLTAVAHDITLLNTGTGGSPLKVDTTKILTRSAGYKSIDSLALVIGGTAPDGSETKIVELAGITVTGTGTIADPYKIKNTGAPGTNPLNAINVDDYGWISDVVVPGSGATVTGTNNKSALDNAIAAAQSDQWVIVSKDGLISTPLDTIKGPKNIHVLFLKTLYTNGSDIFRIINGSVTGTGGGAYEQHTIIFNNIIGRVNMPAHSKATHDAGTSPPWPSFTGVPVKLINVNQCYIEFNKVEGTKSPFEIISSGGAGSQENTVRGRYFYKNANGIVLTSLDGNGWCDKNKIFVDRISGGLALKIDGYSGTFGGEVYNGAFRSNQFHFLAENIDSIAVCNGDITEPWIDATVEGGGSTGILGTTPWQMRSVSPNFVRSPRYTGGGYYDATRLGASSTGSMGIKGVINVPIWSSGGSTFYGDQAKIDANGNIIILSEASVSQATRTAAPAYVKFLNAFEPETILPISTSTYTVAAGVRHLIYNNTAGTVTLPSAPAFPSRYISIYNQNANPLTISNVIAGGESSILGGKTNTYFSDGVSWYAQGDGVGVAGQFGVYHTVTDADVTVAVNDYTVSVYNQSTARTITLPDPTLYTNRVINLVQSKGNTNTINLSRNIYQNGAAESTLLNNSKVTIQSDGAQWNIIMSQL